MIRFVKFHSMKSEQVADHTWPKKFTFFQKLFLPLSEYTAYKRAKSLVENPSTKQIEIIRAIRKLTECYTTEDEIVNSRYVDEIMELLSEKRFDVLDRIARNNLAEFETDFE